MYYEDEFTYDDRDDDDDLEHALGQVKEIRSELRYRCGQ